MDPAHDKEDIIKKMYEGMGEVFKEYLKRFNQYAKENPENSKETINILSKISSSLGYIGQVHASLAKAYEHEKRILELEKKYEEDHPGSRKS